MTRHTPKSSWVSAIDALRTQLWPLPMTGVMSALAAGFVLPHADSALANTMPAAVSDLFFGGGAAEAREVLATIAGSAITVTSLTFSLTVVTLQLASGQYSPRLLRTFARDRFVQGTLALFLATFVYALTILRTVREGTAGNGLFVPKLSVTMAYLLALSAVVFLVFFLAHLARGIRVETLISTVHSDASQTANEVFAGRDNKPAAFVPAVPAWARELCAGSTGFVNNIDSDSLLSAAEHADAVIMVFRTPGEWLVAGTPIASAWPLQGAARLDRDVLKSLGDRVRAAVRTSDERTTVEDVAFGLQQLTDVAVRALSPSLNDPTTAIHTLGHSAALLCELVQRRLGPKVVTDDQGVMRVVVRRPDLVELLDLAVSQPRRYGASDPSLLSRLFELLQEVAWSATDPEHKTAISDQLARLRHTVSQQRFDDSEYAHLARLGRAVEAALAHAWRPQI
ncbi:DUF2254 domain-containing protein [Mycobacterium simiae]|uniref:DUF2254 domain-containing protein n=1 Tax=Mycobacterium simiae TaxID=1784 RepID=A0A5B1BWT7_MYCSI|nr:DUF2254 domain-containing protein [Mycobacterium simiae]KAA1251639.1 DUF2254 domain-containing protein [Mycobacterium simiae]